MEESHIFLWFYAFALAAWLSFQAAGQRRIAAELEVLKQQLSQSQKKLTRRVSSQKLSKIWMKRSAYTKQQNAKQFISTLLDEYEQLSGKVYQRQPDKNGLVEDRDLLFP